MSYQPTNFDAAAQHALSADQFKHLVSLMEDMASRLGGEAPEVARSPYLNITEAAAYCRLAVQTLYNRRAEIERLPGVRRLLFTRESLDKWLATRKRRR